MRPARLALALLLTTSLGCAQKDWIDRTLVTVDVTGTWYGTFGTAEVLFELEQKGASVKGVMRIPAGITSQSQAGYRPGPIEGTVAGDVFPL